VQVDGFIYAVSGALWLWEGIKSYRRWRRFHSLMTMSLLVCPLM